MDSGAEGGGERKCVIGWTCNLDGIGIRSGGPRHSEAETSGGDNEEGNLFHHKDQCQY